MRKLILLLTLLFQVTTVFCQRTDWGAWSRMSCFQGIDASVKSLGYVSSINSYSWNVRLRNNYPIGVDVTFHYEVGGEKINVGLVYIKPGEIYTHTPLYVKNNFSNCLVTITNLSFWCGATSNYETCPADCDDGTPNYILKAIKARAINNTASEKQLDPNFQRQNAEAQRRQQLLQEQKAVQQQQQTFQKQQQLQQGIQQLAGGIAEFAASLKAQKEQKRLEEEQNAILAKQKAAEEEIKKRKIMAEAANGDYRAQVAAAETAFEAKKYSVAENYYLAAIQNPKNDKYQKAEKIDYYLTTLAIQGKKKEFFQFLDDSKSDEIKYTYDLTLSLSKIFCREFANDFMPCDDNTIAEGIKILSNLKRSDEYYKEIKSIDEPGIIYAYLQATGLYTKYGISDDTKAGLAILEKEMNKKYSREYIFYYTGMIYLNGTKDVNPNEKKALKCFKEAIELDNQDLKLIPGFYSYENHGFFNPTFISYIKISEILSRKDDADDRETSRIMRQRFYRNYKYMIPNSDLSYFKEFEKK